MPAHLRVAGLALCCLLLNGCVTLALYGAGSIERGLATGDEYGGWKGRMPPIPAGAGRLIVYPGGGRSFLYAAAGIGKGGEQLFVVDRDVCRVLGHSFVYLDLAAGPHEVSAGDVSRLGGYRKGRDKLDLEVAPAAVRHVRIDREGGALFARSREIPVLVDPAAAEAELGGFPIYHDGLRCRSGRAEDRRS